MMRTVVSGTLLTLAVLAASAAPAAAQVYPERVRTVTRTRVEIPRVERYQRDAREEQTDKSTRTVKIGANGALDVSNIAGDIVITRGGGSDATIEIVKTARGRTVDDARELLKLVQVEITERGGRVEVRTQYPRAEGMQRYNRRNINVSVAYTIAAPEATRVTARSISGNISARDIRGELSLESVSGNVQIANAGRVAGAKSISGNVELTGTKIDGALDASSVSGTVTLRDVSARRLDLGSISGDVVIDDVNCEVVDAQSVSGDVRFSGTLAGNGRYELTSHSGEVRVAVAGGTGFELEATSFSGSVRSDLPITMGGAGQEPGNRRRSLRGTYGDGSAVLDLTTFSGSILITKR
jgi:DUF4097 and DUF4098 domain-containing protein YvlB